MSRAKWSVAETFAGIALITWSVFQLIRWPELQRRMAWSDFDVKLALSQTNSKLLIWVSEVLGVDSGRWQGNPMKFSPWFGVSAALVVATLAASMLRLNRAASIAVLLIGLVMAIPSAAIAHDLAIVLNSHRSSFFTNDVDMVPTQRCEPCASSVIVEVTRADTSYIGRSLGVDPPGIEEALAENLLESRRLYEAMPQRKGDPWPRWETRPLMIVAEQNAELPIIAAVIRGSGLTQGQIISRHEEPGRLWTRPSVHRHPCAVPVVFADDGVPVTSFASWRALVEAADSSPAPLKLRAE